MTPNTDMTKLTGIQRIAVERKRQIEREGWTPAHDDQHAGGEIASGAVAYAWLATAQASPDYTPVQFEAEAEHAHFRAWPFDDEWWKPSQDPIRNLEKAGAMIAAQIDVLLRKRNTIEATARIVDSCLVPVVDASFSDDRASDL